MQGGGQGWQPPKFGEMLKNQAHLGRFLPLVGQKSWQTMDFVSVSPPRFFLPIPLCKVTAVENTPDFTRHLNT